MPNLNLHKMLEESIRPLKSFQRHLSSSIAFIFRYRERVSHPSPFLHWPFHLLPWESFEVGDCNLFADHQLAQYHPQLRLHSLAVGPPGNSRSAQWGPRRGEVGVGAKSPGGFLTRSEENWARWAGKLAEGGLVIDLPFEPRELAEGLCLSILGLACARSER